MTFFSPNLLYQLMLIPPSSAGIISLGKIYALTGTIQANISKT